MTDIKELKKLVKYLRKEGITEYKDGELQFKLGEPPQKTHKATTKPTQTDVSSQVNIDTDYPTEEEMLFYSAGGPPPKDS